MLIEHESRVNVQKIINNVLTLKHGHVLEPLFPVTLVVSIKRIYSKTEKETVLVLIIMIKHYYFTLLIKKSKLTIIEHIWWRKRVIITRR